MILQRTGIGKLKLSILLLTLLILMGSCHKKDKGQGIDSIKGDWEVVNIKSRYGVFTETGHLGLDVLEESGNFGFFNFQDDSVDFSFTRNDTLYESSGEWDLSLERIQDGFSKVNRFTLEIEGHYTFECEFENGTRNSEKNAKEITLSQKPSELGYGVSIELKLEKI